MLFFALTKVGIFISNLSYKVNKNTRKLLRYEHRNFNLQHSLSISSSVTERIRMLGTPLPKVKILPNLLPWCKVKTEPEEDKPNILKKKLLSPPSGISASKKLHHSKKIKEEYLPPIVNRVGSEYVCLLCDSDADGPVCGEAKPIIAHMKEKHDLRLYICDVCGQEFRKRNELSLHVDEHVALEEGDFQCEVCNRIFSNLRLFRIHKRMHYPQNKAWTCDICGKRYR